MGGFAEYENYDALGLAELVRRRETTPAELLDAAIERAEARNPALNAIVRPMYEEARAAIAAGLPEGPLQGVPFLLKDLHALYEGVPTTNGCGLFRDAVADHDSELVSRYKRAGLVIFGKTNTPELGLSVSTEPRLFGPCRNPWNLDYTTGGSSGGAGAVTAARIVPAAHASDGGGSIRIPASCCGLFGLKPTRGRVPMGPDSGEGWSGMSAQHVVSLSVRDSAALLDATHGPAPGDPYAAPPPARPFLEEVGAAPGRLRIALDIEPPSGVPVDPECERAVRNAAALCESLGHDVREAKLPVDADVLRGATGVLIGANVKMVLDARAAQLGQALAQDQVESITWMLVQIAQNAGAADYAAAVRAIHGVGRTIGNFFEDVDVVLTPMLARPPIEIGVLDMMSTDVEAYMNALGSFTAYSQLFNATGQPAMSVPLHWTAGNLPVGIHFAGRFGDEATLFRLAAQLEQAQPWTKRLPPLT
jgi:amidase/6-aminohexanoate-cyclic-dimer hydrolase